MVYVAATLKEHDAKSVFMTFIENVNQSCSTLRVYWDNIATFRYGSQALETIYDLVFLNYFYTIFIKLSNYLTNKLNINIVIKQFTATHHLYQWKSC